MKSFTTLYPKILAACLFLAMIISLGITGHRILSEDRQSTVDVVVSAHEMETLALESGLSTPQLWQKLKKEVGIYTRQLSGCRNATAVVGGCGFRCRVSRDHSRDHGSRDYKSA